MIDDPTTASAMVSLASTGPTETHLDTVARAKESLAERGVRVTVTLVVASRVGVSAPAPGFASPVLHEQRDE